MWLARKPAVDSHLDCASANAGNTGPRVTHQQAAAGCGQRVLRNRLLMQAHRRAGCQWQPQRRLLSFLGGRDVHTTILTGCAGRVDRSPVCGISARTTPDDMFHWVHASRRPARYKKCGRSGLGGLPMLVATESSTLSQSAALHSVQSTYRQTQLGTWSCNSSFWNPAAVLPSFLRGFGMNTQCVA